MKKITVCGIMPVFAAADLLQHIHPLAVKGYHSATSLAKFTFTPATLLSKSFRLY